MASQQLRILLIDEARHVSSLLKELQRDRSRSLAVDHVAVYDKAVDMISKRMHDVCLVDYRVGDRSGLEFVQEAAKWGCLAPIILMTDHHDSEVDLAAIAAGAADYLVKSELTVALLERSIRYAMERKRVEEALRRSEENLARAQKIARVGSWDWSITTNEMFWSDETYRILGLYPHESEPSYESFIGSVHMDDRREVNRVVNEAIYLQKPLNIEHRIVAYHGGDRIVHQQGEVIRDGQGNPLRLVGTINDITDRRRVEDALRHMEETFSKAFHASPDWMAISNASDGCYMEVNDAFVELTGYERSEVIGRTSVELGLWADSRERTRMLELLDDKRVVRNLEVQFRMKSGEIRYMLWSADVIDLRGAACLIAVARDITDMRKLEHELDRSQEELQRKHDELSRLFALVEAGKREWETTMDHLGDMVVLADPQGKIRRCNRAFQEFVQVPFERLIGGDWVDLLHQRELITGTIYLESMELFHSPTGRWFVLNPYPFEDPDFPESSGTVIVLHDSTEIRRYSEQVERINRELEQVHDQLKQARQIHGPALDRKRDGVPSA